MHGTFDRTIGIKDRVHRNLIPGSVDRQLHALADPAFFHGSKRAGRQRRDTVMGNRTAGAADAFLGRHAKNLFRGTIGTNDPAILAQNPDCIADSVEGGLPLLGLLIQLSVGQFQQLPHVFKLPDMPQQHQRQEHRQATQHKGQGNLLENLGTPGLQGIVTA